MTTEQPEIRAVGASVGLSLLGHAAGLAALIWLATQLPPAPLQMKASERAIEIVFEQPRAATPVPEPAPQPTAQPAEPALPEPPPPELAAEPDPPATPEPPPAPIVEAEPPPQPRVPEPPPVARPKPPSPPPKPVVRKPKKPPAEPRLVQLPSPAPVVESAAPPPPATPYASQQTAALPLPHPGPAVSGSYRGMLSAWFEAHKRYPEGARARGEQGRVGLSFRVARSGQVLNFAITGSSGYADLDAAVEAMMRGAILPPFPADMTANDVQVTVSIRFGLAR